MQVASEDIPTSWPECLFPLTSGREMRELENVCWKSENIALSVELRKASLSRNIQESLVLPNFRRITKTRGSRYEEIQENQQGITIWGFFLPKIKILNAFWGSDKADKGTGISLDKTGLSWPTESHFYSAIWIYCQKQLSGPCSCKQIYIYI